MQDYNEAEIRSQLNEKSALLKGFEKRIVTSSTKRADHYNLDSELKQKKRDIKATAKAEGRTLTDSEKNLVQSLTEQITVNTDERKENDKTLLELKWDASIVASQVHQLSKDLDSVLGVILVHDWKENTLGKGKFMGEYVVHSPEWHAQRLTGIGGSDVAIIMGESPFTKPEKLFLVKTGQLDSGYNAQSTQMALGDTYEPIIQRRFAAENPQFKVWNTAGSWVSIDDADQLANIDGLYSSDGSNIPDSILEIKAVSNPEKWIDGPPVYYRQQTLWYMDTFGFSSGKIAALINQIEYVEYDIIPEPGEIEEIRAKVEEFKDSVRAYKNQK